MNKRWILAALLFLALGWWIKERWFVSEQDRVQRQLAKLERAVENNGLLALSDAIAPDYQDEHGLDRGSLIGAVRSYRSQQQALLIHISDLRIDVAGQKAEATFVAKVLAKPRAGGEMQLDADRLRLFFRKEKDGSWKLVGSETPKLRFD